jgi:hypothetical protein
VIIETIHAIAAEYRDEVVSRMVIYSDLIENSRFGSFHALTAGRGKQTLERVGSSGQIPDLKGTVVEVYGFGRNQGRNRKGRSPTTMDAAKAFLSNDIPSCLSFRPSFSVALNSDIVRRCA